MRAFPAPWGNYLLEEFVETRAPDSVSFWPQTLAWQFLGLVLFFFVLYKIYHIWKNYKRNSYRREALAWLSHLPDYKQVQAQAVYRQLPALIRKTALHAFGHQEAGVLSRERWDNWLDQQCDKTAFVEKCPTLLHQLAYAPQRQLELAQIQCLVKEIGLWIQYHRGPDD